MILFLLFLKMSNGMIWFGTYGGGLNRFDPNHWDFQKYSLKKMDLANDTVYGILEDDQQKFVVEYKPWHFKIFSQPGNF